MVFDATVASVSQMTPRVKQFRLVADDHRFDYQPGQHTQVHFQGDGYGEPGEEVERPYTATSLPGTHSITLAIKRYDDGTASVYMHDREPGDTISIDPVDGNLYLRDPSPDVALVASGTGVTPMVPMLRHYLRDGEGQIHFFFGERTQEDIMYRETIDQLEAEHENLTVVYSLSQEEWAGPEGHVQEHLDDYLDSFDDRDFYVCGVPEMVVETKERLTENGVTDDQVFTEGWEGGEVDEESSG